MNALRDFFTPEAGQARTNWLNNVLQTYVADPVNYYLGPSGVPNRLQAAGNALQFTDAGDMPAAADAGRRLWNDPSIGNAAEYAAAGAAMMLPMYSARMGEGIADLADDARRFWADEEGAVPLWGGGMSDPTQTGWTFRDVDSSLNSRIAGKENMRVEADTSRIETLPIRQLYATQGTVNPDFATTTSSAGELPLVVRKDGRMYVRDGHHRIVRASEEGAQNIRSRFIDLDGRDTSAPLFDYDPSAGKWTSEDDLLLAELLAPVDPATERAQDILDLLTSGRASEVTDDMLDLGDPVQNARLNMYLFDNYDLPMDEASRMARAGDTDAFHATRSTENFSQFRPGARGSIYMASTPEGAAKGAAGQALEVAASNPVSGTTAIMPLRINSDDVRGLTVNQSAYDALPDVLTEGDVPAMAGRIRGAGLEYWDDAYEAVLFGDEYRYYKRDAPTARYQDLEPGKDAWGYRLGAFNSGSDLDSLERSAEMGKRGFMVADEGGSSIVASPAMPIRSRFARFDPRLAHLRNLSAGLAGTGILAPALMQDDQSEIDAFLSENGY